MKRIIGLVCEGPRDSALLASVIDHILPTEDIIYRYIQPDESLRSPLLNGWKGVWRWCDQYGPMIDEYASNVFPQLDLLVVQMDGDVSRTNRVSHCNCNDTTCPQRGEKHPTSCDNNLCPIRLPCSRHGEIPAGYVTHLRELLSEMFSEYRRLPILFLIPCDSTDTWIVAALDDFDSSIEYETIKDPWVTIISQGKYYHSIRISSGQKSKKVYDKLVLLMLEQWEKVVARCTQAAQFQQELEKLLGT